MFEKPKKLWRNTVDAIKWPFKKMGWASQVPQELATNKHEPHHFDAAFPTGQRSRAAFAFQPAGQVIIFVHGFGGHPVATWNEFYSMLLADPLFHTVDLIFFGYESKKERAEASVSELYDTLRQLHQDPNFLVDSSLQKTHARAPNFRYTDILLVAHSMGGALARRALLYGYDNNAPWAKMTRMLLYAPAHKGGDIIKIGSLVFSAVPYAPAGEALLRWLWPSLQDLETTSEFVTSLSTRTKTAADTSSEAYKLLRARAVIFGKKENIVDTNQFCHDLVPYRWLDGFTHSSVCKPSAKAGEPVQELKAVL